MTLPKNFFTTGLIVGFAAIGIISLAYLITSQIPPHSSQPPTNRPIVLPKSKLPKFSSCADLNSTLAAASAEQRNKSRSSDRFGSFGINAGLGLQATQSETSADYSTTNVQVAGVDEADIVKTDGSYIYSLSNNNLSIVKADGNLNLTSSIAFTDGDQPKEMFIAPNRLLVIGNAADWEETLYKTQPSGMPSAPARTILPPRHYYGRLTFVHLYDTSSPSHPRRIRSLEFESQYVTSRLIADHAYLVMNKNADVVSQENIQEETSLPMYKDTGVYGDSAVPMAKCTDISYIPPIIESQYLIIASVPLDSPNDEIEKEIVLGAGDNVYASLENLYVAKTTYGDYRILPLLERSLENSNEKTEINKFVLSEGEISHLATGEVEGRLLNQFSMDEYEGNLRLATTIGHVSQQGALTDNRVYVLDSALKEIGSETGIAPGEQIYSARFMGKRGYLVTFKKVDPFFTLDLANPRQPKVAGKLKIPGFSDYLHPFDENHIIGVGKETVEAEEGNFAWYQGIKMAIFDVSDFANPRELHRVIIGDRGTDSEALRDHKAFLFSKEKNLLVIPVTLAEIDNARKQDINFRSNTYGQHVFQGAFVFDVSLEEGFKERGKITHYDSDDVFRKSGDRFYGGDLNVRRSIYIGDTLYTISNFKIKANSLIDLSSQGDINLQ